MLGHVRPLFLRSEKDGGVSDFSGGLATKKEAQPLRMAVRQLTLRTFRTCEKCQEWI